MKKILIICIIVISCNSKNESEKNDIIISQNKSTKFTKNVAKEFIKNSDSIILISHFTYDNSPPDIKTGKLSEMATLLNNGELNRKIVIKAVKLVEEDYNKLAEILDENVVDDVTYTHCFEPHNTVLAYKGKSICYIDFCFDCLGYYKKEFLFDTTMNMQKYKNLEAFFLSYGLKK
jgi:hypothetical protein